LLLNNCDDSSHSVLPVGRIFESKEKYMGPVAQKVASLSAASDISAIDFSPDGSHLVIAAALGPNVWIWKWTGQSKVEKNLRIPQGLGPGTWQSGLRYSPDGRLIAIVHGRSRASDGFSVVRIWDAETGAMVGQINESLGGGDLGQLAFTPDSKFLLRTYDRIETIPGFQFSSHDVGQYGTVWGIRTTPFIPEAFALSPDGKLAALAGEVFDHEREFAQIRIVEVESHRTTVLIDTHWQGVAMRQVAWSPDGRRVVVGTRLRGLHSGGAAIGGFDVGTGRQVFEQTAAECDVTGLALTPNGKYILQAGKGMAVEVWDGAHERVLPRALMHYGTSRWRNLTSLLWSASQYGRFACQLGAFHRHADCRDHQQRNRRLRRRSCVLLWTKRQSDRTQSFHSAINAHQCFLRNRYADD
jgi:WD40 repeat protein